jgi:amino acid adenylation domain-containing protein
MRKLSVCWTKCWLKESEMSIHDQKRAQLKEVLRQRIGKIRYAPLSFGQERLWFLAQFSSSNVYNIPLSIRMEGVLDHEALEHSFTELVNRHEILRTSIRERKGTAAQAIAPPFAVRIPLTDLSSLPVTERDIEVQRLSKEQHAQTFDLTQEPLWRVKLLRLEHQVHVLLLTIHHIVADGWSTGILVRDLSAFYRQKVNGDPGRLPDLPVQYADYARWQRNLLQGKKLESELDFWRNELLGAPALMEFPLDRKRQRMPDYAGTYVAFELSRELSARLKALAAAENASLFMVLLAAFQILLARYSGQTDICVGTPVAGRNRGEFESVIGFFINMLVLRGRLDGQFGFRAALRQTRQSALQAYSHQDLPFELLVDALQVTRETSYTPLFQAVFSMQNFLETADAGISGLKVENVPVKVEQVKFDLSLTMRETSEQITGSLEYRTALFEESTVARFVDHFTNLLEDAVHDPEKAIEQLRLLSASEREQLLFGFREPAQPPVHLPSVGLTELFAQQVSKAPEAIALVYENERLTYRQLNSMANQLARHLIGRGVGRETVVGLAMERSTDLVLGILAILKAGGVYLPLDKEYPSDRLKFMLQDVGATLVVLQDSQQRQWLEDAGVLSGLDTVVLREDREDIEKEDTAELQSRSRSENGAYVIYTSGSSGNPKGVMVTHRNVVRLFEQVRHWFSFNERDVWTLFHSCAFDFSVWEIWGALLHGGRLVIVPYWISRSPDQFHHLLIREGVTVLNQTPSAFRQLMYADQQSSAQGGLNLRYIIFGGEALEPRSLRQWLDLHGDSHPRLINMYGITETTVHVTYRVITASDIRGDSGSLIGSALPDLQMYVLDSQMEPVAAGIRGELYVGGAGLARGYTRRGDLTAQRFVPSPFGPAEGSRLYRTGDLARRLSNGDVEYCGRIDQQVKIRGFRIELEEIETNLLRHPAIREAVVVVRDGDEGDKRLIAYLVGAEDKKLSARDVRDYLKRYLPDHMIPSAFMMLNRLPLTANGKVDRNALTSVNTGIRLGGSVFAAPGNEIESILTEIWSQVLGVKNVGVDDNFFALGGDSILSLRVLSTAKGRGLRFSLPQLFQHQTIRELARTLAWSQAPQASEAIQPFALINAQDRRKIPEGIEDAYPVTRLQLAMLYQNNLNPAIYHNVQTHRVRGRLNEQELRSALDDVVASHSVLRTSFDLSTYSEPLQLVHEHVQPRLVVNRLLGKNEEERERELERILEYERNNAVDWSRPPLLRARVDYLNDETFHLIVTEHHVILDGWSVASLFTELLERYWLRVQGQAVEISTKSNPFRDFVAMEQQALRSERDREFWIGQVVDTSATRFPAKSPVGEEAPEKTMRANIPPEVSDGVKRAARLAFVPIKSMLLAAHLRILSFVSGQKDVTTGMIMHGRPETANSDRALGLFLNAVPIHKHLTGGTWIGLGRELFELEKEVFTYRYYPSVEVQRQLGRGEFTEATFNFTYFHIYKEMEGISDWELEESNSSAKNNFPLSANFMLEPGSGELSLDLVPGAGRFSVEQVQALLASYERALEEIAKNPEGSYETSLLTDDERKQLLEEWQGEEIHLSELNNLADCFAEQVRKTPAATALRHEDVTYSYAELNQKTNQLARYLRRQGVCREAIVAIAVERSPEFVIGVLAVLKAGGAYLPLDLDSPAPRLHYMLENCGARLVLVRGNLGRSMRHTIQLNRVRFLDLDEADEAITSESREDFKSEICGDSLAYVIYTSGSTGVPKGVMVKHSSLVNHMRWMAERFEWNEKDTILFKTAASFDASVWEVFAPLMCGAVLAIAPPDAHRNFSELVRAIQKHSVAVVQMVPSALRVLMQEPEFRKCTSLKQVLCGGEEVTPALLEQLWAQLAVKFENLYGPTEATIDVLSWSGVPGPVPTVIPIGQPLPNVECYVLGENMDLVPPGTPGEIYLGGAGLARGYLGRPDLTAESFVPNPFAGSGARLYRTGDYGCWSLQGQMEFLGRVDQQAKIHGYRIETAEIESVLNRHPEIKESAVAAKRIDKETSLIGYVIARDETRDTDQWLRGITTHLERNLPRYMVPQTILKLSELPRLSNGKVDRRSLPLPSQEATHTRTDYVAPRTPLEGRLAGIWSQVLGADQVGVNDDFLQLGGHSLLAIRVMSIVEKELEVELSLNMLFETRTVAGLAKLIEELKHSAGAAHTGRAAYRIPELETATHEHS